MIKLKTQSIISLLLVLLLLMGALALPAYAEKPDTAPVPPKKVEKAPEKPATPTIPTAPAAKVPTTLFDMTAEKAVALYRAEPNKFMVKPILKDQQNFASFFSIIQSLKNNTQVQTVDGTNDAIEGSFLIVANDSTRIIMTLNTNNTIQAGGEFYSIPADVYKSLMDIYNANYNVPNYIQWMIYMQAGRATGVESSTGSDPTAMVGVPAESVPAVIQVLRSIRVSKGSYYTPLKLELKPSADMVHIRILFAPKTAEDGRSIEQWYDLWLSGNTLYVESSDLKFGCEYTLIPGEANNILKALKDPASLQAK